ncbi:MAG: hypothetical protein H0T47_11495 [Planctomycetaceae bacterium]|nr:hypothetical protein [Planctomycetaceae bacterium]
MPDDVPQRLSAYRYLAEHPEIFAAIGETGGDELRLQKALRARFPDDAVRLALSVVDLRAKAARKFPFADRMWFDRARLEQATPGAVASHKARRFKGEVWDYCCGAGADSIALAAHASVTAVDSDPIACLLTELNAAALSVSERIRILEQPVEELRDRSGLLHVDPDRRAGALKRAVRVEDYAPSLETLRGFADSFRGGAIKVSPAANFGGKFDDVEIEVVSVDGEAKEATIWFGELAQPDLWRATVLPEGATLAGDPLSVEPVLGSLGGYVFDPDPAVVRAGLIDLLCGETGLRRLDDAEEYLTADDPVTTPFANGFRVLAEVANNERAIKNALRDLDCGRLEIKARRLPIEIERLHRTLPTNGDRPLVLLFARIAGKARAIIAERVDRR